MQRAQLRAARALLGWSQNDLADASGVSAPTIKRIEPGEGPVKTSDDIIFKIETAFAFAGIEFIASDQPSADGGIGVRLAAKNDGARLTALRNRIAEAFAKTQAALRYASLPSVEHRLEAAVALLLEADEQVETEITNLSQHGKA